MSDWYVSSAAWTAIPQFTASHAYSVGDFVRPLTAPAFYAQYSFRCTTAGTSGAEPAWSGAPSNGSTVTSGGATFTNVTGQSTYGWSAAAGNWYCLSGGAGAPRYVTGDRIFLSSDHSETGAGLNYGGSSSGYGVIQTISVNRAGSVPPVVTDYLAGAVIACSASNFYLDNICNMYWQGITFTLGGTTAALYFSNSNYKAHYFKNCAFVFTTSITTANLSSNNPAVVTFDNTTISFNNAGQRIIAGNPYAFDFKWINTPAATLGTVPTVLFAGGNQSPATVTCRGLDLSAVTTTLYGALSAFGKVLFDSCRIASGVVRFGIGSINSAADEVELVNCYDGTSFLAERHTPAGDLTTEFSITLSGGAQDNVGVFSHKMISSTRSDPYAMPLEGFWMDVNNATIGGSSTATVEIVSSASLNNNDISLLLEYEGTSGSSLASFVSSLNPLATVAAVPTSTATWNSLPATPVRQHLQVTFTPQTIGRVRGQVRLGKPSTTVYVNPQLIIT